MSDCTIMQLTANTMGAIAIIGLWGTDTPHIVGHTLAPGQRKRINFADDDALLLCIRPDYHELHLHGGIAVIQSAITLLQSRGAHLVQPQSPEAVTLLCGGIIGEVAVALACAQTETAALLLAAQALTGLTRWVDQMKSTPRWELHNAAQWLLTRSDDLNWLLEPARVAIIGEPNAGKSTLANALLGKDISITSPIAGTTRDWVDALGIFTHGDVAIPVRLVDTAGMRETDDGLEAASILRTHAQTREADLVIILLDATRPAPPAMLELFDTLGDKAILALNKTDLPMHPTTDLPPHIKLSAATRAGLDALNTAIIEALGLTAIAPDEPWAFTTRQRAILEELATTDDARAIARLLGALQHG